MKFTRGFSVSPNELQSQSFQFISIGRDLFLISRGRTFSQTVFAKLISTAETAGRRALIYNDNSSDVSSPDQNS